MTTRPAPRGTPLGARLRAPLGAMTSPEVKAVAGAHGGAGATLLVPLGSTEQHGPHLPLDTDTRIAVAIAERAADARPDVVTAPALAFGASGEHAGFPGTISIGTEALRTVLVELVRSLGPEFDRTVFVNGHGGNADAVTSAVKLLTAEEHRCMSWWPRVPGGDAHAGRTETSLMLAIAPDLVRTELAAAGATAPLGELMADMRTGGLRAVTTNGVLGDPAGATADEGADLLSNLVRDLVSALDNLNAEDAKTCTTT